MKHLFVSDVHLGAYQTDEQNKSVEKRFLCWLDMAEKVAEEEGVVIYLLGDIFDFWFEYKRVIPTTYTTVMSRLKEMTNKGIEIHFFKGNHDMWLRSYLKDDIGLIIHNRTEVLDIDGERVVIGHGHDIGFKRNIPSRLLWILFTNRLIFSLASALIHPNIIMKIGANWSRSSRRKKRSKHTFLGEEAYITKYIYKNRDKFCAKRYIFGHFHTPTLYKLKDDNGELMILSDWSDQVQYGEIVRGQMVIVNC